MERPNDEHRFRRRIPLISGAAALVVAGLLGLVIAARDGRLEIDEDWMLGLLELRTPAGEWLALAMNWLGGGIVGVFVVPLGIAGILLLARRPWAALYFVVASAASAGVVQLLKHLFGRARPEDILVVSDYGSFPSGHTANAATIAVALGIVFPRVWVWALGAAYAVLMAVSRTYLGAHWLTDTLGGLLVGLGVALVLWAPFARVLERERRARRRGGGADAGSGDDGKDAVHGDEAADSGAGGRRADGSAS